MNKVLVIIPDNNKGKYISKGFSSAFRALSFYVYERKLCDLNLEETQKNSPDIIFIFWSGIRQKDILINILSNLSIENCKIIHCGEFSDDIPECFRNKAQNYIFEPNGNKYLYIPCVNPELYRTDFSGYKYTITFAGNPAIKSREIILAKLIYNFGPINIFCRSFDFYKSFEDIYKNKLLNDNYMELYKSSYLGYSESSKELAEIYSSSKVNISLKNDLSDAPSYRCFEITASGGFLIAPYSAKTVNCFDNGADIETYTTDDDLIDKIKFYLKNLNIAQNIALNGKRKTIGNYSTKDVLKKMIRKIND